MSDGSTMFREPTETELALLRALIRRSSGLRLPFGWAEHVLVKPLKDGGMGSFEVAFGTPPAEARRFGSVAAELQFTDVDGIEVLVSLNTDAQGEPYEVDVWKTDFAPVMVVPDDLG